MDSAAPGVDDPGKRIPRGKRADPALKGGPAVQPFEHGDVGVVDLVVRVDARVGRAGEDLVVSRVAEVLAVGYAGHAIARGVSKDLAPLGHGLPEKWQQRRPALFRRFAPETAPGGRHVAHAPVVLVNECLVSAAEDLLPPQAVEGDQKHARPVIRRGRLCRAVSLQGRQPGASQKGEDPGQQACQQWPMATGGAVRSVVWHHFRQA